MNEKNDSAPEKKLPTEDAKKALRGALKKIPKSLLFKVIYFIYLFILNVLL